MTLPSGGAFGTPANQPGPSQSAGYCPGCRFPHAAGDRFCSRCGAALDAPVPPSQYPTQGQPPLPPAGAWTSYGLPLSEWWPRVGAMLLDGLVLAVPTLIVTAAVAAIAGSGPGSGAAQFVLVLAVGGSYFGLMNGLGRGATLGNRAAGIAVRDARSDMPIGLARGVLRWFVRFALYLFVLLPGLLNDLWPLWDGSRQTLADKVARSVMIRLR